MLTATRRTADALRPAADAAERTCASTAASDSATLDAAAIPGAGAWYGRVRSAENRALGCALRASATAIGMPARGVTWVWIALAASVAAENPLVELVRCHLCEAQEVRGPIEGCCQECDAAAVEEANREFFLPLLTNLSKL